MAIERMDIVTDGAATIYGTDAVADVVNIVPYTSMTDSRLRCMKRRQQRRFRKVETSFLGGTSIGDIDIVVAGSYQDGATLEWHERPEYGSRLTHNGGSNLGSFIVFRDDNGNLAYGPMASIYPPDDRPVMWPGCQRRSERVRQQRLG